MSQIGRKCPRPGGERKCPHRNLRQENALQPTSAPARASPARSCALWRASYYRNFASKEDVLLSAAASVFDGYRTKARERGIDVFEYEGILLIFRYFNAYRQPILVTYRAGLASLFLRAFDEHIDEIAGDMSCTQISRYLLPFISGGLFNVFSKWLEGGLRETPEEMAELMAEAIQSLPLPPRS